LKHTHYRRTYVLDASALLVVLYKDPGSLRVLQLLKDAEQVDMRVLVSVANWGEVFYQSWQRRGEESARRAMADFSRLPLHIVAVDVAQAMKAAEIKVLHKIPYVDCIVAALAALNQATLVTSDRDFEKLGRHFPILWLAR
jgi:predicted nucleic acid-binding protein